MQWLEVLPLEGETLYLVGTTTGLFSTTQLDGTNTVWMQEGADEIGYAPIAMVDARASDGYVAVATHGSGIFTATIGATDVALTDPSPIPTSFTLGQNYPNPFNTTTTIPFSLSEPASVRLTVHDLQGRTIATLVAETYPAGRFDVAWRAANHASGTYFYRLQIGAQTQSRQFVLVK